MTRSAARATSCRNVARRTSPQDLLNAILGQFGRAVTPPGNIVVVQSELGSAPAIARALDRLEHDRIVGTLAGDDTVLVVRRGPSATRVGSRSELSRSPRC